MSLTAGRGQTWPWSLPGRFLACPFLISSAVTKVLPFLSVSQSLFSFAQATSPGLSPQADQEGRGSWLSGVGLHALRCLRLGHSSASVALSGRGGSAARACPGGSNVWSWDLQVCELEWSWSNLPRAVSVGTEVNLL